MKFYRDVDQHDFGGSELTSRYFVQVQPMPAINIEFPDYQETIKRSAFTYQNKTNATVLLDDACFQIHELIEDISKLYGANVAQHSQRTRLDQLGDLTPWRQRTLAVMYEQNINRSDTEITLYLSSIRIDQLEDGRLQLQKMLLTDEKLEQAEKLYGIKSTKIKD